MKLIQYFLSILLLVSLVACEKDPVFPEDHYYFHQSFADSSGTHPKGAHYQTLLDDFIRTGAPGVSVMINDESGTWLGAGGFADLKSKVVMQPGNQFQIASISKVFTAACIFTFVDEGLLSIDDHVGKWIDASIIDKVDNSGEAKIRNLLGHTSGIKDYYTTEFEMERYNKARNVWTQEDVLAYIYGKNADFELNKYYGYSNTNYLLLGMILEEVSGKSLKEVYEERIFGPLGLMSAYYGTGENRVSKGVVKGYYDFLGLGKWVETDFLYEDELGIGGDGGIAINAQDLGMFMKLLMAGQVVSESSLAQMQDWFEKPFAWAPEYTITNGYGLEYLDSDFGKAFGHTGGVDGFASALSYYPGPEITIVVLFNFVPGTLEVSEEMDDFGAALERAAFE